MSKKVQKEELEPQHKLYMLTVSPRASPTGIIFHFLTEHLD